MVMKKNVLSCHEKFTMQKTKQKQIRNYILHEDNEECF